MYCTSSKPGMKSETNILVVLLKKITVRNGIMSASSGLEILDEQGDSQNTAGGGGLNPPNIASYRTLFGSCRRYCSNNFVFGGVYFSTTVKDIRRLIVETRWSSD